MKSCSNPSPIISADYPSGTPPLLPIPLPAPSTSRRVDPRKRLLLTTPRPGCEVNKRDLLLAGVLAETARTHNGQRVDYSSCRHYGRPGSRILGGVATSDNVRLNEWQFSISCVPRPWRLEHALTHWRTLVAVPRLWL
ncbi:hypothetical protein Tco_0264325 [Tanacetum coccineum]